MSDTNHGDPDLPIQLPAGASMADYQRYVHQLEAMHGWLEVDLVHNCFLMGEEVGELFKAIRKHGRYFEQAEQDPVEKERSLAHVGEELVDVFNYLCALANRLDIDLEDAFRQKNARNQRRQWKAARPDH